MSAINKIMPEQNARAVKYVRGQVGKDAKGRISEINSQISKGLARPYSLSTASESIHSIRWASARESYIVSSFVKRKEKEVIALSDYQNSSFQLKAWGKHLILANRKLYKIHNPYKK